MGAFVSFSLGPLVSKVKEYQVETIVDTLCTNMLSDKEQLRDISSIGLKTVIGELPPASSGRKLQINNNNKQTYKQKRQMNHQSYKNSAKTSDLLPTNYQKLKIYQKTPTSLRQINFYCISNIFKNYKLGTKST